MPDRTLSFRDGFAGTRSFDLERELGDFVIRKSDHTAAYQLAVVVDDADANVTNVIRGDDLIDSTPRQMLLYKALGMTDRIPAYIHLPLVVGPDGRRLAKRHGDSRLSFYRSRGVPAARVRALLARWLGIEGVDESTSIESLIDRFQLDRVPRSTIVHDEASERSLTMIDA